MTFVRIVAAAVSIFGIVSLMACATTRQSGTEHIRGYMGIGRIKWVLPENFAYYWAVPHFTSGARIKCKEGSQECEIQVASRDYSKTSAELRGDLIALLKPHLEHSVEQAVNIQIHGKDPEVIYATITDPRPKEQFRLLTAGYAAKGPALIRFQHLGNTSGEVQQILEIVHAAQPLDALQMSAWKLTEYKMTCEERFPIYKSANDAAFAASVFSSVNVVEWHLATSSIKPHEIQTHLENSRRELARAFDAGSPGENRLLCEAFPKMVAEATRRLSLE